MINLEEIPFLGAGIGYRSKFEEGIFSNSDQIGFLELLSDHYINCIPGREDEAINLSKQFPIVLHGVSLSLGTDQAVTSDYLSGLVKISEKVNPLWVSDHICFTKAGDYDVNSLTPLSFNKKSVEIIVRNIKHVKSAFSCPFLVENISYLFKVPPTTMSEYDFINDILELSDCFLLLDLTNLYNNSVNFNYDPYRFLDGLTLERVVQIHLAGGVFEGDLLIDSHNNSVPAEVFNLLRYTLPRTPNLKGINIERDGNFPAFSEILNEINQINRLCASNIKYQ